MVEQILRAIEYLKTLEGRIRRGKVPKERLRISFEGKLGWRQHEYQRNPSTGKYSEVFMRLDPDGFSNGWIDFRDHLFVSRVYRIIRTGGGSSISLAQHPPENIVTQLHVLVNETHLRQALLPHGFSLRKTSETRFDRNYEIQSGSDWVGRIMYSKGGRERKSDDPVYLLELSPMHAEKIMRALFQPMPEPSLPQKPLRSLPKPRKTSEE